MAAKLSKYRGRSAHSTRSSRQGASWDSTHQAVYDTPKGRITKTQYFNIRQRTAEGKGVPSKLALGDKVDTVYTHRECICGGVIQHLPDEKAVCSNPHCSTVFNDGGNTEGMVRATLIFGDGHRENAPPPKKMFDRNSRHSYLRSNRAPGR
jgi:hypothetical protein